jgi:hypothetical protein
MGGTTRDRVKHDGPIINGPSEKYPARSLSPFFGVGEAGATGADGWQRRRSRRRAQSATGSDVDSDCDVVFGRGARGSVSIAETTDSATG